MRTFLFRYEIGQARGVMRVDAKNQIVASAIAKLKVERQSHGLGYFLWCMNQGGQHVTG